jgi:AcrR family transcriptional regulator
MHVSLSGSEARPRTQTERRARTRAALLEAAARGFSRYGYGDLVLEKVAADAGYTRGALYHLFTGKQALAVAVVEWGRRDVGTRSMGACAARNHTGRHHGRARPE